MNVFILQMTLLEFDNRDVFLMHCYHYEKITDIAAIHDRCVEFLCCIEQRCTIELR